MMLLTSSRVILYVGIRYNFSFFNVAKKLSIRALSKLVLCQDNGHIKPLFFSKISKMHKLVAFIPRFA